MTNDNLIDSQIDMDAPENVDELHRLGVLAAEANINDQDFEAKFDLLSSWLKGMTC